MTIRGVDAAGVSTPDANYSKTVYIDNSRPVVSFAGSPSDAPSTAGAQTVTATASGSPSGIEGLWCSLDGGPGQWTTGPSARIPVSGIGQHTVTCDAADNAVDGAGNHGSSDAASWTIGIRQPTVEAIGFAKTLHPLRCRVEIEGVFRPHRHVQFADQPRTEPLPIALQPRRQVVVLAPVLRRLRIDRVARSGRHTRTARRRRREAKVARTLSGRETKGSHRIAVSGRKWVVWVIVGEARSSRRYAMGTPLAGSPLGSAAH